MNGFVRRVLGLSSCLAILVAGGIVAKTSFVSLTGPASLSKQHPLPQTAAETPDPQAHQTAEPSASSMEHSQDLVLVPEPFHPAPLLNASEIATLQKAIDLYENKDLAGGDALAQALDHPTARALLEWVAIRNNTMSAGFQRINQFLQQNSEWASNNLRRRAEETMLAERRPSAFIRAYFTEQRPLTPGGKLALAQAWRDTGDEAQAIDLVRGLWRGDLFGRDLERRVLDRFDKAITKADHKFRMDRFLFKEQWDGALRVAGYLGPDFIALARARQAVTDKAGNAQILLNAVPASVRPLPSYTFAKAQFLRRSGKGKEAAEAISVIKRDTPNLANGDEWWVERRLIARRLLDDGDPETAYAIVREHAADTNAMRIEAEWHAGWISLRFLNNPAQARQHFQKAAQLAETPISVARAFYWLARAAEEQGESATAFYERAARHATAYYGQLARVKLGLSDLPLRYQASVTSSDRLEQFSPGQALRLAHEAGLRNVALALYNDLAQRVTDATTLDALGNLAFQHREARGMLTIGKAALQKGLPLDRYAYPTLGIPSFTHVGDDVGKSIVYAIARQESAFNAAAISHAGARGLMQLMPATARRTAQRFGLAFHEDRLTSDPSYNASIGSAHLGELLEEWKGSYILTFASYNAGSPNVKKWIAAYGDPRSPHIDPIDWVERIPFTETRNYVQRVMENFQVYRHKLGERTALLIEQDLRAGRAPESVKLN